MCLQQFDKFCILQKPKLINFADIRQKDILTLDAGIYILEKIRNYTKTKVQNGETLPKLNIGIYSKFDQYYRYNIIMYDFIHIIQFLIPIWSWISKMMQENITSHNNQAIVYRAFKLRPTWLRAFCYWTSCPHIFLLYDCFFVWI